MTEPFILFTVAGTTYGLRSTQVAHVELIEHVTPVPNAAHFVDGVVFSRGEVVPLGLSSRLLVATAGGRTVGLVVDSAREFVAIDAASIQPPSAVLSGLSGKYLEGVANIGDRLVLVLNLTAVLTFTDPALEAQT
jgi:purine-binding chemotaxis protein CheW